MIIVGYTNSKNAFHLLKKSYQKNRLSHAYLFVGEKGTGKKETAFKLAKMFYCQEEDKPCNTCGNCIQIDSLMHPNVFYIEPEGQTIKKEQIQSLIMEFSKTSLILGPRFYIINQADKMTASASNSLLKFIEEPVDVDVHAILLSENLSNVLPTIVSRCQIINFQSENKEKMKQELSELGIDARLISILPLLTNNKEDAILMVDEKILDIVTASSRTCEMIIKREPAILYLEKNFSLLTERKENISIFVSLMFYFFMDIIHKKSGIDELAFSYMSKEIEEYSKMSFKTLLSIAEVIKEEKNIIRFNVNPFLCLKAMLIKLEMRR